MVGNLNPVLDLSLSEELDHSNEQLSDASENSEEPLQMEKDQKIQKDTLRNNDVSLIAIEDEDFESMHVDNSRLDKLYADIEEEPVTNEKVDKKVGNLNPDDWSRSWIDRDVYAMVLAPLYQGAGRFSKQKALQTFVSFLEDPDKDFSHHLQLESATANMGIKDKKYLVRNGTQKKRESMREMLLEMALQLHAAGDGRFLAGVLASFFAAKEEKFYFRRYVYRSRKGRLGLGSWRQWIQNDLLHRKGDEKLAKTLDNVLTKATGVTPDADSKVNAGNVIKALFDMFNQKFRPVDQ
jgi:CRISPR/Cas system CSM-associated protein Csm2 small subunit